MAWFYLGSFTAIVISLLWRYTTTHVSLAFLLPTSMNRTVGLFMVLAAVGTAHLIARMVTDEGRTESPVHEPVNT